MDDREMLVTNVLLSFPFKCLFSSAASIAVSAVGLRKNSLSFSGALAAVMVGFTLTMVAKGTGFKLYQTVGCHF